MGQNKSTKNEDTENGNIKYELLPDETLPSVDRIAASKARKSHRIARDNANRNPNKLGVFLARRTRKFLDVSLHRLASLLRFLRSRAQ